MQTLFSEEKQETKLKRTHTRHLWTIFRIRI